MSIQGKTWILDSCCRLHVISCPQARFSIQGTDYIANPFFLNLKVSRTTIKNLRWQFGGDIIPVTFGKSVTLLVPKLKKKCE